MFEVGLLMIGFVLGYLIAEKPEWARTWTVKGTTWVKGLFKDK